LYGTRLFSTVTVTGETKCNIRKNTIDVEEYYTLVLVGCAAMHRAPHRRLSTARDIDDPQSTTLSRRPSVDGPQLQCH